MNYQEHLKEWIELAQDYPTKALLTVALQEYQEQAHFIEVYQGKLDGQSWSRNHWGQEEF